MADCHVPICGDARWISLSPAISIARGQKREWSRDCIFAGHGAAAHRRCANPQRRHWQRYLFFENEVVTLHIRLMEVNAWLGVEAL